MATQLMIIIFSCNDYTLILKGGSPVQPGCPATATENNDKASGVLACKGCSAKSQDVKRVLEKISDEEQMRPIGREVCQ